MSFTTEKNWEKMINEYVLKLLIIHYLLGLIDKNQSLNCQPVWQIVIIKPRQYEGSSEEICMAIRKIYGS